MSDTLIPSVGYARCSTDEQTERSIPDQIKAVEEYAKKRGYRILRWYIDEGISGDATEKRLEFLRMLSEAVELVDFEAILCWDQSRFGRFSPQEAGYRTWPLIQAGVRLVTTDKGPIDWSEFTGWLTYSVDQHAKHQFIKQLSRDVARGQLEAMNKASWIGCPPYGYRIEGEKKSKRLVLGDPDKVRVVKRIFHEYVEEGRSLHNIAERLQAEGYPSPGGRGKPWRFDTVRHILENPAYCGDYAGGRYGYGKYNRITKNGIAPVERADVGKQYLRPEAEWIIHRDTHKAIIDRPTFEKAKAILAKGKTGRSRYTPENNPFILTGMLRCGRCGSPMWAVKNHAYNYYECGNRQHNGQDHCVGCTVREDVVLRSIADHLHQEYLSLDGDRLLKKLAVPDHLLKEMLLSPDGGEAVLQKWKDSREPLTQDDLPKAFAKVRKLVAPPKQPAGDRKRMEKDSRELAEKIDKAMRNLALLEPENIPVVQDEIRRMRADKDALDAELRKRPPTDKDINAEVLEVLDSLLFMGLHFQSASMGFEQYRKPCRSHLRKIAGITVHTTVHGYGRRTRHEFESGEIAFYSDGVMTEKENLHKQLQRLPACR